MRNILKNIFTPHTSRTFSFRHINKFIPPRFFKPFIVLLFFAQMIDAIYSPLFALDFKGRANFWSLYQTDDVDSTTVAVVYNISDLSTPIGVVVGKDIAIECSKPTHSCTYRKIGEGGELTLEHITDAGRSSYGKIGGDSLLTNIGISGKATEKKWSGNIDGNFSKLFLDNRALLGGQKNRFRFYEFNAQYEDAKYEVSLGRKSIQADILVDGVSGKYFFGAKENKDSKSIGFFAGFAPDTITKNISSDSFTFGPTFHFVPDFSSEGPVKLLVESSLVTEIYKGDMNRFYLFSRAHFTPVKELSFFSYSTLELPWMKDNANLKSSQFTFQTLWHPNEEWFFSIGFSQFAIDRFLQEQAVRWVTDNSSKSTRVSDSLDKSQRYRLDLRASFRPIYEFQPFIRARYERRTFDSNKLFLNSVTGQTPSLDLGLLNRKNAYSGTGGVRLFLWEEFETESSATFSQRFQSSSWEAYQFFSYDTSKQISFDAYFQFVSSNRTINNSVPSAAGTDDHAYDFYAGTGVSYRFLSDFLAQIRYDFSNEDEKVLDRRTITHSALVRLDYRF
ncbi:MAG: hypothetical protein J0L93_09915 [Deltaproteobacteria bacterium]|nr:hypothetical protein [Deltaproteobacteria bacterium]